MTAPQSPEKFAAFASSVNRACKPILAALSQAVTPKGEPPVTIAVLVALRDGQTCAVTNVDVTALHQLITDLYRAQLTTPDGRRAGPPA